MVNQFRARVIFVCVILLALGLVMVSRLFAIQVLDAERYALRSRSQAQQRRELVARRGSILDRSGRVLGASMQQRLSVGVDMLGIEGTGKASLSRVYPNGDLAGPVLGYIGRDGYGLAGAEFSFDYYLRGENGWAIVQKDGLNQSYRKIGLPEKAPVNGSDVYLTIDVDIQKAVQSILRQTVKDLDAKGAMAIVMDPKSGKILAMVNEPSFNPNIPLKYPLSSRRNRCLGEIYEPGSTFKIITAAAALQEKLITPEDTIDANNGVYRVFNQVIRDVTPRGRITFSEAMTYSSNVCFAKTANLIGNDRFYRYVRNFGIGVKSGIDLPGEEEGILHPVRSWSGRTRVTMAIGYEVSTTFMQMMLPFAAVANGGVLVSPLIYEKVVSHDGNIVKTSEVTPVRRVIREEVAVTLRQMLELAVEEGTGRNAIIKGISVGGKTGTSQKSDSGGYAKNRYWSSFIGFAPADDPVLLCGVLIDEPAGGEMGGAAAAPAFRKIMNQIITNPGQQYARTFLTNAPAASEAEKSIPYIVGSYVGQDIGSIRQRLDSLGISLSEVGEGQMVVYQSPAAGTQIKSDASVIVFLNRESSYESEELKTVPDLFGKDVRDAFNVLNFKGMNPVIIGSGRVKRQIPAPGRRVDSAQPCTLYSAYGR